MYHQKVQCTCHWSTRKRGVCSTFFSKYWQRISEAFLESQPSVMRCSVQSVVYKVTENVMCNAVTQSTQPIAAAHRCKETTGGVERIIHSGPSTWLKPSAILSCHHFLSHTPSLPISSLSRWRFFSDSWCATESLLHCIWLLKSHCLVFARRRNVGEISTEGGA